MGREEDRGTAVSIGLKVMVVDVDGDRLGKEKSMMASMEAPCWLL